MQGTEKLTYALERLGQSLELDRSGLGERIVQVVLEGIRDCFDGEHNPDGSPWPELSAGYAEWKGEKFPGRKMGVLHGLMSEEEQLRGDVQIGKYKMTMSYGVDEQAKIEARAFQAGGRRFYALTPATREEIRVLLLEWIRGAPRR